LIVAVPHPSVLCFAAVALTSCNLAHPACLLKVLRSLFVHAERTVVFPFCTSNVICDPFVVPSLVIRNFPSTLCESVGSLVDGFPSMRFHLRKQLSLLARAAPAGKLFLVGCQNLVLWLE